MVLVTRTRSSLRKGDVTEKGLAISQSIARRSGAALLDNVLRENTRRLDIGWVFSSTRASIGVLDRGDRRYTLHARRVKASGSDAVRLLPVV